MAEALKGTMEQLGQFLLQQKGTIPDLSYANMLQTHVSTLKNGLQKLAKVTPSEATDLSRSIAAGPWNPEQKTELCQVLSDKLAATGSSSPTEETKTQECPRFGAFLSQDDRRILADPSQSESQKLHQLASRCMKIGLVLPSESCKGRILASGVAAGLDAQTASAFYAALTAFKKILKRKREMIPGKTKFELAIYPDGPDQLPNHFKECYATDPAEPLSIEQILKVSQVQALRKSSKALQAASSSSSSGGLMPLGAGLGQADQFTQFMAGIMHVVNAMQNQQQGDQDLSNLHLFKPKAKNQKKALALPAPADQTLPTNSTPETPEKPSSSKGMQLLTLPAPTEPGPGAEDKEDQQGDHKDEEQNQNEAEQQLQWLAKKPAAKTAKPKAVAGILKKPAAAKSKVVSQPKAKSKAAAVPKAKSQGKTPIVKTIRKKSGWVVVYKWKATDGSIWGKWWSPEGKGFPSGSKAWSANASDEAKDVLVPFKSDLLCMAA
ncbi:unnamed protein product [Symbiodinium sp. CCMP2592]|nr:unnamed protein product [Symbiodinium sp. CCMP2592]